MNQFSKYLMAGVFCLILISCDKQLSEPPANARVDGTAITDQKSAQTALNGVYYRFANVTSDNVTNWANHQAPPAMYAGMLGYGFGTQSDERNENANSAYTGSIWNESYLLINAANGVIDGINAVPDASFTNNRKTEIIAESRFLRAYGHFKLLTYFAEWFNQDSKNGVLIRDKFITLSQVPKARSTVAESFAFILGDLDFAIANAPASNPNYYATRWAAMALKMRVLMCHGQQSDYVKVDSLGNALIQGGPFELENNLKDLFYINGLNSKEVILGVKPQPSQEIFFYIQSRAYYPGQSSLFVATQQFKDLLQNDPRGSWMIGPATPYQAYSPDTYYFLKYIGLGGSTSQLTETSYALRLSEVYLMMAEAIIRTEGSDLNAAKLLIKTVMGKAGVTDFSAVDNANTVNELLLQNYYEVERNLTAEDGIEWLTLMRLPFATVKQLKPTILSDIQFYFPVPRSELDVNPLFGIQNTGYGQ
ncbi:RagB/SusD family nutrient uptake outer membrane protein [Chitinophaga sp. CF118]|uniref:RagB/SusD family nutrient uptake outer membrane protein n=1 Tax=Chitinophaga sp. CF118 TaxID=1884367 RepID=UPI000B7CC001|nr:RagB/SusD family nutrient uptake outer membrane protein [Chitinophaga sp. CF118]